MPWPVNINWAGLRFTFRDRQTKQPRSPTGQYPYYLQAGGLTSLSMSGRLASKHRIGALTEWAEDGLR